ncbi:hypothetical protein HDU91_005943 [Kappamyces sp. JEL0680]|nr:hypothetical protein HDU91_005943 [Kappamyces sp. JEL0680]
MKFSLFVPPNPRPLLPALFFLAGLTCNEDNFITKAGALSLAAKLGVALVCPDTSPRGLEIEGQDDSWDFGTGAGFYIDATEAKWRPYRMYSYITEELFGLLTEKLGIDPTKVSIMGHSMGGHGALVAALKSRRFVSCSAFAPIAHPSSCPWGIKAFTGYLGADKESWKAWDATELVRRAEAVDILIDQGTEDQFLKDGQLLPHDFVKAAAANAAVKVEYREREGYDHSYWFIQTFVEDHLNFHARHLL